MAKIKVSQKTIDQIKKMGMTKALGSASSNKSAEFQEGLRRMYGEKRLTKAKGSTARSTQPVGGVQGSKRAQVMTGPTRTTRRVKPEAKVVKALNNNAGVRLQSGNSVQKALAARAPKGKMFSNLGAGVSVPRDKQPKRAKSGKTFKEKFNTKTKKFGTPN